MGVPPQGLHNPAVLFFFDLVVQAKLKLLDKLVSGFKTLPLLRKTTTMLMLMGKVSKLFNK